MRRKWHLHSTKLLTLNQFSEAGLIISGGFAKNPLTNIEMFPAEVNCSIPPFPAPGITLTHLIQNSKSSQGRHWHTLSVINNGRAIVACGGGSGSRTCIFWRHGQAEWKHYHTMRFDSLSSDILRIITISPFQPIKVESWSYSNANGPHHHCWRAFQQHHWGSCQK